VAESSDAQVPDTRGLVTRLRASAHEVNAWFSSGSSLPDEIWAQRHRWILALLWLHVPAVFVFALVRHQPVNHSATEASIVMVFAAVATLGTYSGQRRFSTVVTSLGLMVSSAVLVHLANGAIEMHFHYFVMVGVVTLYQDWLPFLVAIVFVVAQHGIMGVVDPHSVYSHADAQRKPWQWAAVHGGFILAMSAVGITSWRLNESLQRRAQERELKLAEAQEVARLGSWELNVRTGEMEWSQELYRLLELDPTTGPPSLDVVLAQVHPDDRDAVAVAVNDARTTGGGSSLDFRVVSAPELRWLHGRVRATVSLTGRIKVVSGTAQDVTDRKLAEAELSETLSLLTATLDSTADGILVVDLEGSITSFNQRFVDLWKIPDRILESRNDADALEFVLSQVEDPDRFAAKIQELYARPDALSEDTITFIDGRIFERLSMPQRVAGETVGRVWSFRDVTERRRLEHQLSHQAFHDSLTALPNQALFRDRVDHALSRATRGATEVAVMFVDLDDFKTVNDSLGHTAGDELLVTVSDRLRNALRASDTAARLGGDEFAVLLEDLVDDVGAQTAAEHLLRSMQEPFHIHGHEVVLSASIGITFGDAASTCDQLLRNADLAMYTAKRRGKNRFEVYRAEMHAVALDRLERESALRRGLERSELVIEYQPVVALPSGRVKGFEALVRWQHPELGLLQPSQFVQLAEETGLVGELGRQVLVAACMQTRRWQLEHPDFPPLSISVNVSPRQLQNDELVECVAATLDATGLPPSSLVLEITETVMMHDTDVTITRLEALKALGLRLAVDDFGTGYSSLSYLQRFPVDILKIDRAFVSTLGSASGEVSLAPAIVSLARTLDLDVVAEGVETAVQGDILAALGCEFAQGYHFGRPASVSAIDALLARDPVLPAGASPVARTPVPR
jgi:diguanylate cyclase (GGDEF)-like protein